MRLLGLFNMTKILYINQLANDVSCLIIFFSSFSIILVFDYISHNCKKLVILHNNYEMRKKTFLNRQQVIESSIHPSS